MHARIRALFRTPPLERVAWRHLASATHFTITANASRMRIEAPSATNHLTEEREANEVPGERHLQGDMAEARLAGMVAHIGAFYGGAYRPEGDVRTQAEPIARACAAARKSLMDVLRRQRPLVERVPDVEDVVELMRPFRTEKTWFVWGAKFLHFLRPDVFPIIDRRIERALGHGQRISNSPGYLVAFCRLVRDVMLENRDALEQVRRKEQEHGEPSILKVLDKALWVKGGEEAR